VGLFHRVPERVFCFGRGAAAPFEKPKISLTQGGVRRNTAKPARSRGSATFPVIGRSGRALLQEALRVDVDLEPHAALRLGRGSEPSPKQFKLSL
jgi:hypothetical protein